MKILLGVDGSSSSDAVLQEAAGRPWPEGSEFNIVTVVDPFFFTRAPALLEQAKSSTQELLREQAKLLIESGWTVNVNVILDNPRHALPRAAGAWRADLVMLGSHGRSAVGRLLLGSTAQAVLRHAQCSVEIVRPARKDKAAGEGAGMRVMIPTDGSEYAEWALQSVAGRPWPTGSVFKILACPEYPVLVGEYPYYPPEKMTELIQQSSGHANESARAGEQLLIKAGLNVNCEVTEPKDTPASAILGEAEQWKADLVVMGSHGRRGFDRLILGSVSETVALHSRCSVEVVRKPLAVL